MSTNETTNQSNGSEKPIPRTYNVGGLLFVGLAIIIAIFAVLAGVLAHADNLSLAVLSTVLTVASAIVVIRDVLNNVDLRNPFDFNSAKWVLFKKGKRKETLEAFSIGTSLIVFFFSAVITVISFCRL